MCNTSSLFHSSPETVKFSDELHFKDCEEVARESEQMTINPLHEMMANNTINILWVFCFPLLFLHLSMFLTKCCSFLTLCCRCNWRSRNFCLSNSRTRTPCWRWAQRCRCSSLRWSCQRIFQSGCVPVSGGLELVVQWIIKQQKHWKSDKQWVMPRCNWMDFVINCVINRRKWLEFVEHGAIQRWKGLKCMVIQRRNDSVNSHPRGRANLFETQGAQ